MITLRNFFPSSRASLILLGYWCGFEWPLLASGIAFAQDNSASMLPIDTPVTVVTPAGQRIDLPGMRPQVIALSQTGNHSLHRARQTSSLSSIQTPTKSLKPSISHPKNKRRNPMSPRRTSSSQMAQLLLALPVLFTAKMEITFI